MRSWNLNTPIFYEGNVLKNNRAVFMELLTLLTLVVNECWWEEWEARFKTPNTFCGWWEEWEVWFQTTHFLEICIGKRRAIYLELLTLLTILVDECWWEEWEVRFQTPRFVVDGEKSEKLDFKYPYFLCMWCHGFYDECWWEEWEVRFKNPKIFCGWWEEWEVGFYTPLFFIRVLSWKLRGL